MHKIAKREIAPRAEGPSGNRLARLFDTPLLARVVPHLPPETLHQIIRHRGLDACADIVSSATPAQLNALLDLDLWRAPQPGRDGAFDVERFGEWLEMLADIGDSAAARTVAALDIDVVIAGLCRYVRVFDPGIFEPIAQSDDEAIDRHEAMREGDVMDADVSGARLEREVGGYIVRARRTAAWDAIVALLVALDTEHREHFHAVMEGCRRLANSNPEVDGLDDLLLAPDQHLDDVSTARAARRSQQGYATPADARAFLQMARQPRSVTATAPTNANPIAAAYFRAANEAIEVSHDAASLASASTDVQAPSIDLAESIAAVVDVLTEAGLMPERPRALLAAANTEKQAAALTRLRQLMEYTREKNVIAYYARTHELAFLANVLVAGCSVQSRPFTPQEASDAAASICNLGLECRPETFVLESFLRDHAAITAFEVGWSVLHHDVSMFAGRQVISTIARLRSVDSDLRRELIALRRSLVRNCDAGTPWLARDATEALAALDVTAWIGVRGLLDECPILPTALTAILEGRTTSVSPTAFEFISTAAQIGEIRTFMTKLVDILAQ